MTEYAELHAHSCFSLLDGASSPEALAARAAGLGMPALALTDHDAVYGAVRFAQAAEAHGIKPIFGAELTLQGGAHLTLLVENGAGWRSLCALISRARANAPKGEAALPRGALADHTGGLIALSGCRKGEVAAALRRGDRAAALDAARWYLDRFGPGRFWIELQRHLLPGDDALTAGLVDLARRLGVGYVATNDAHYAARGGHRLQDVLVCIKHLTTLDASAPLRRPNSEFCLKGGPEMAALFAAYPGALANTLRVAERCEFRLRSGLQDLPPFPAPAPMHAAGYLRRLCARALRARYPGRFLPLLARLNDELGVIGRAGLADYFLVVWDIVQFARAQGILCQGRGSAANSLVAYLLGISPIDPLAHDLVFERFLSDERRLPPDIDLDIQADRREEVIQYVYRRYGPEHTAMACTFVTFRARSAVRDVGRALGLPPHLVDAAAKALDTGSPAGIGASPSLQATLGQEQETLPWAQLLDLCAQIDGLPRHLGIHNGGMVVTGSPITERVPVEPAAMPGRVVCQWDKDALEDAGLVKIDLLGLRMLAAVAEAVEIVEKTTGTRPDLDRLAFDDPEVYAMIARADTVGVFQVESRAQAGMLPRLKPACFADLVIAISLIRPGPIQGNMVHPYLRRRLGEEPVTYPHPSLEPALKETLGVVLFQEQVLKVARDLAGFTPGQGEVLRRALGSKHAAAAIEGLREAFMRGAEAQGVPAETAREVFEALAAFAGYSFPKSHAAAFAVIVYRSAWLKRCHPAAFYAALLNHQPMGFWSPAVIVGDAKRHGVGVLPVDVNRSGARCAVEGGGIRLGLGQVRGLGEAAAARLLAARGTEPFTGLADLCRRARLPRSLVENLVLAGALDGWGIPRRKLLWDLGTLRYQEDALDLAFPDGGVALPDLSEADRLGQERAMLGLSAGAHPVAFYREALRERGILGSAAIRGCKAGQRVQVAGLVVVHQAPPTAHGVHFLTLEDEDGLVDVIVRPDVYEKQPHLLRCAPALVVAGVVQRKDGVVSVLAQQAAALDA